MKAPVPWYRSGWFWPVRALLDNFDASDQLEDGASWFDLHTSPLVSTFLIIVGVIVGLQAPLLGGGNISPGMLLALLLLVYMVGGLVDNSELGSPPLGWTPRTPIVSIALGLFLGLLWVLFRVIAS